MLETSEIQTKPQKMDYASTTDPVAEMQVTETSFTGFEQAGDSNRYSVALGVSLLILVAVVAGGFFATRI